LDIDEEDIDEEFLAPSAARVAARAIVLAAVMTRGMIESDGEGAVEERRGLLCRWLDNLDVARELEDGESAIIRAPAGLLDRQGIVNASWRSEGMVVLAWSLGRVDLPGYDCQCDPVAVAGRLGFLAERAGTVLASPSLREAEEIERGADLSHGPLAPQTIRDRSNAHRRRQLGVAEPMGAMDARRVGTG